MDNLEHRSGPTVKVPIVRGLDPRRNVPWEMSFNKTDGILKTKLLRAYSLMDPRVAPLVSAIKSWAQAAKVKDAHEGTLSSYSWTLMTICYLQCGCTPAVLPCLQTQYPADYADKNASQYLGINVCDSPPAYTSANKDSLGDLLMGFFDFYLNKFK